MNRSEAFWAHRATSPPADAAAAAARWALALLAVSAVIGVVAPAVGWPWQWLVAVWLLLPLALWRWMAGGRWSDLGLRAPRNGLRTMAVGVTMVAGLNVCFLALALAAGWHGLEADAVAADERARRLLSAMLAGVLLAGVGEELAYRGALLRLAAAWRGPVVAVAVTATLFAVTHTPNLVDGQGLTGIALGLRLLSLALIGIGLGYAAWRTGGLWLPMAWHAGGNLTNEALTTWWVIEPAAPGWWAGHQTGMPRTGLLDVVFTAGEVALLWWLADRLAPVPTSARQDRRGGRQCPG